MKTAQQPIHSGFNAQSTAEDVIAGHDLTGKIAIVTGGSSGVGLETVKALAGAGARVVVGARDADKAAERLAALNNVSFFPLDLADPVSVDAFAKHFLAEHQTLHILINNAGVFRVPQLQKDKRGFELQFGVNHLGHFQLTGRLWPALKRAGGALKQAGGPLEHARGARVVTLSSVGHRRKALDLADINFEKHPYDPMGAYGQSKTANALFALELDKLGTPHHVRAFAVHPGAIETEIFRYMTEQELRDWKQNVKNFKTPEQGAATSIWCAVSEQLDGMGGVYCEDCNIAELVTDNSIAGYGVRPHALDPAIAAELWRFSEKAVNLTYEFP